MIVRLTVYSDVFVNVTLTLDEAALLEDGLAAVQKEMPGDVAAVAAKLQEAISASLTRAMEIQRKKEG